MPRAKWCIKKAIRIATEAGLDALRIGGEAILTEAIDEAPVQSGTLRRSGTVTVGALPDTVQVYDAAEAGTEHKGTFPQPLGTEKAVYVSFNTPYARRQHEEIDWEHPLGGKAKYLEGPFARNRAKVKKYAELRIRRALREAE